MNIETLRRIETLKVAIRWNEALLAGVPAGTDLAAEKQLESDRDELEALLKRTAA